MIIIIYLKIKDVNGDIKLKSEGEKIDVVYEKEYRIGDTIEIKLSDCEYAALKLDETLTESIVYLPDKSFSLRFLSTTKERQDMTKMRFPASITKFLYAYPTTKKLFHTV